MRTTAKYLIPHRYTHKNRGGATASAAYPRRALLVVITLFIIFTIIFTLMATKSQQTDPILTPTNHMSAAEIASISSVLRRCSAAACNLLVFGLTHDTLFWKSINNGGRTVFVAENTYEVSIFEKQYPFIEAYEVQFTTRTGDLENLIGEFRREIDGECRPVQNLLFSDCKLAVNDLPNHLYDVVWDVIVVDGPQGYSPETPGRMAAIFTAGVMARSSGGVEGTHVFVHEIERKAEKVCSDLFLCRENLVEKIDTLGHFVVGKMDSSRNRVGFCDN